MNHRRRMNGRTIVVRDLHIGPIPLGHIIFLEESSGRIYLPSLRWRADPIRALNTGYRLAGEM